MEEAVANVPYALALPAGQRARVDQTRAMLPTTFAASASIAPSGRLLTMSTAWRNGTSALPGTVLAAGEKEPAIGHNERYSHYYDGLMDDRILHGVSKDGELQSLTPMELRLGEVPLTVDPKPHRKVKAWVRFGTTPIRVDAVLARWTPDAAGILFDVGGKQMRCWVWNGAVEGASGWG